MWVTAIETYFILLLNGWAFISMFCFMREGSTFKRHFNILAYVLMIATSYNVFEVLVTTSSTLPTAIIDLFWQFLICITVIRHKGNVSYLIPWGAQDECSN